MPKVSIVTSTFGRPDYIKQLVTPSIRNQSFQDWEWFLASDYDSPEIVAELTEYFAKLNDARIHYFNAAKPWYRDSNPDSFQIGGSMWNIAGVPALNEAIEKCSGEFLFRIDDDDFWMPSHIESHLEVLTSDSSCDIVYGRAWQHLHDQYQGEFGDVLNVPDLLAGRNQMFHSTVAWKTNVVGFEKYSDNPASPADLQQWQKFAKAGHRFKMSPRMTVKYLQRCSVEYSKAVTV